MNEQHLEAYLQIIQALSTCLSGAELHMLG